MSITFDDSLFASAEGRSVRTAPQKEIHPVVKAIYFNYLPPLIILGCSSKICQNTYMCLVSFGHWTELFVRNPQEVYCVDGYCQSKQKVEGFDQNKGTRGEFVL